MSRCDFKIVLLGSEHVGKTSLVLRFVNCRFNAEIPYQNTVGAAFCAKAMRSKEKDYSIGIWDTAGSERYEAMTRIYYRGAHAAIICYEPSSHESWTRLRHWLHELRTVEDSCKVYLCGTKKDLLDGGFVKREVAEEIVNTYSQDLNGHFLTSSKTGENVDELFQKIVDDLAADVEVMKTVTESRLLLTELDKRKSKKDVCAC
ncbi:ras-related protein Rab-24-like [Bombyx mandarina]|uniref:Ras-related protein Rab-24 n=2 Tax=Bombyx TaxID=7090 RepID=A0A8R2AIG3_BOMMO|nr:ras-related protein Rab-24 [Bombyx mori]XP_028040144.1 ras-related protein Rab-24-like [Bombyx mandarina]